MATATQNKNGKTATSQDDAQALELKGVEIARIDIPIIGVTPLITHRWAEKAKEMMRNSETVKRKKEARDPEGDFQASRYILGDDTPYPGRDGVPATGIKSAIVQASRLFDGVTMTQLKQILFVVGYGSDQLLPIEGEARMREDMVRLATGVADIRWRAEYFPWSALITVEYVSTSITAQSVVNLVNAAGNGGICEWRPSSPKGHTGTFGRFRVDETKTANMVSYSPDEE